MFKQQVTYLCSIEDSNNYMFKPFTDLSGAHVSGLVFEVQVLRWVRGYYLDIKVIQRYTTRENTFRNSRLMQGVGIYDKDMESSDASLLGLLSSGDIRGRYAEERVSYLVLKYADNVIKTHLPEFWAWRNEEIIKLQGEGISDVDAVDLSIKERVWIELIRELRSRSAYSEEELDSARYKLWHSLKFWQSMLITYQMLDKSFHELESLQQSHVVGVFWGYVAGQIN